ncbi:N-6 DNA methylase [Sulfolobus tengchongensis]|uniref:site-specific DNA-methyltransferase (adenine-specific) n=1 Tax=Sulfolobus tengchongensis TaxID=207809 RepID=A0AAX4L235_9CREN
MTTIPQFDVDEILNCIKASIKYANSEEDLRIRVSNCIENKILTPLGISQYAGKYEYTLVSGARVDALYGHVIIEYKAPGKLIANRDIEKAKEQLISYIRAESSSKEEWDRYLGIIISDRVAFVRYNKQQDKWILRGPYDVTREVIIKLIEALRGLRRKALNVKNLLDDFGPNSSVTRNTIKALYNRLVNSNNPRTEMLFQDWMRLFKQATGYNPEKLKELTILATEYGLQNVKYDELLYAIQTYYAFVMKLLAAEVVYLYSGGRFYKSYISELDDAYTSNGVKGLKEKLEELESGGIFRQFGYENFLEGDYFSWYLNELNKDLADALAEAIKRLEDYEPATPQLEPESARDLLKRLYQDLIPGDIRHNLGEYYTPDWLADFILDEIGLSVNRLEELGKENPLKPLELKVLDPSCGSGTFLIRYIARLRQYANEHFIDDEILVDSLLKNVVGYDLNPLAVLTARTNYLLMIADLRKKGNVEIPIYLTDSLMVEKRSTIHGSMYVLKTVVGEFQIPKDVIEKEELLPKLLTEISIALKNRYKPEEFKNRIEYHFESLSKYEINMLVDLYKQLLKLEEEGKNGVWIPIIRNAFAPIIKGKFDYVVGNPPWVNWENLPEDYREVSKALWKQYGILGKGAGFKRDLAMLFLARCFDLYLKPGGKQGFLMPLTVFKTQAGAGFRTFIAKKSKVDVIHDLVTLYPFEDAVNRVSAIVVEKVCELSKTSNCPKLYEVISENLKGIKHVIWINRSGKPIPTDKSLEEVIKETERFEAIMISVDEKDLSSPWMQVTNSILPHIRKVTSGLPGYEAHAGVYTVLNQVYFVQIKQKLPDGKLLITNPPEPGQRKKVKQVEAIIEPDLVYPLVRGKDIKKWYVDYRDRYIILPHYNNGKPIPHSTMKVNYPLTWKYFYTFYEDLIKREGGFLKEELKPYREKGLERAEQITIPFYCVRNNVSASFAPYKVVWKYIAGAISGKASSFECAVVEPIDGKIIVPHEKLMLIPAESPDEAYYIAGVLNSSINRLIVASYVIETQISTHVVEHIKVPKYDPSNSLHNKIATLSKKAHGLAKCIYASDKPEYCKNIKNPEEELKNVEKELDEFVAELYGIPKDALSEFKKFLAILSGEEIAEEENEEENIEIKPTIEFTKIDVLSNHEDFIEFLVSTQELCDKAELLINTPWGSQKLEVKNGKNKIKVNLSEGIHKINYTFKCGDYSVNGTVEITAKRSSTSGPKRPRTLNLGDCT